MASNKASGAVDDFTFIMTCLKHTADVGKPNFDEVCKEVGAEKAKSCYYRHWRIMQKWGLTGSKKPATEGPAAALPDGAPRTPRSSTGKRGRPAKAKGVIQDAEDDDEPDDTPSRKIKTAKGGKVGAKVKKEHDLEGEEDVSGDTQELSNGENHDGRGEEAPRARMVLLVMHEEC